MGHRKVGQRKKKSDFRTDVISVIFSDLFVRIFVIVKRKSTIRRYDDDDDDGDHIAKAEAKLNAEMYVHTHTHTPYGEIVIWR